MTVGKDVSRLFTDVLKCITTTNLELKKLVYLYIMNYAKNNEEMAILAVNTFQQVRIGSLVSVRVSTWWGSLASILY